MDYDYEDERWEPGYDPGPDLFEDVGDCEGCGDVDVLVAWVGGAAFCADCYHDCRDDDERDGPHFADPGGNSALRAETPSNPRNLPCPNCGAPNRLTPADRARGYQCDACADAVERGF